MGFARSRRPLDEVELGFFVVDDGGGLDDDFFLRFVEIFDLRNDLFQHIVQQASPSSGQLTPGNKAASLLFLVTSWLSQKIGSLEPTRNNESQIPQVCSEHRAFARRNVLARLVKHCKSRWERAERFGRQMASQVNFTYIVVDFHVRRDLLLELAHKDAQLVDSERAIG